MEFEEFKKNCNSKKCLRRLLYNEKTCIRESKQINCHKSYMRQLKKKKEKENEEESFFENEVWEFYTGSKKGNTSHRKDWKQFCRIWRILTNEEKNYLENEDDDFWIKANVLDVAHIKPRSIDILNVKNIENVVLISRVFHERLTNLLHPVYKTPISNEEVEAWLIKARDGIR